MRDQIFEPAIAEASPSLGEAADGADACSYAIEFGVRIPLRDGVRLSANLYRPAAASPVPTIVAPTPYNVHALHGFASYFASRGYAFAAVDVRGRGGSDGEFDPLIQEGADGFDVVEWLARQPFCDGQVAMWGGSYLGYVQWMTAARRPPHLKTIVPAAAPYASVDVPFRNNVPKPYFLQWLIYVSGRAGQDQVFADQGYWRGRFRQWFESGTPFLDIDRFLGHPSETFQRWMSNGRRGEWWDRYNPTGAEYAAIDLPVLTITGMCDADQPGALAHYREHLAHAGKAARHHLVIGPWDHPGTRDPKPEFAGIKAGPASLVDLKALHLAWYDWVMRGGPRPAFLDAQVCYYLLGADEWRGAVSLDAVTRRFETLHLASDTNPTDPFQSGRLSAAQDGSRSSDHYVHDPRDVSLAALETHTDPEDRCDPTMVQARTGRQLVYHSAPFTEDRDVAGFFGLDLWLAIDQPDTDIRAWVHEVAADGRLTLLSYDTVRARHREGLREERLIETTAPLRYRFDHFPFAAKRIAKGGRLRLVIGPIHSIYAQKNYNCAKPVAEQSVADARTVTVTLHHDGHHPSALRVPLDERD